MISVEYTCRVGPTHAAFLWSYFFCVTLATSLQQQPCGAGLGKQHVRSCNAGSCGLSKRDARMSMKCSCGHGAMFSDAHIMQNAFLLPCFPSQKKWKIPMWHPCKSQPAKRHVSKCARVEYVFSAKVKTSLRRFIFILFTTRCCFEIQTSKPRAWTGVQIWIFCRKILIRSLIKIMKPTTFINQAEWNQEPTTSLWTGRGSLAPALQNSIFFLVS